MKKLLSLFLIVLALSACDKVPADKGYDGYPAICENECCKNERIILSRRDQCKCTCKECHCHHFIPAEVRRKYDGVDDMYLMIIASVKYGKEYYLSDIDEADLYSPENRHGYITTSSESDLFNNWDGYNIFEDFQYEKGYEYVVFAQYHGRYLGDIDGYWSVEEVLSKIKKKSYNLPFAADSY